jgi:hypothetical protein
MVTDEALSELLAKLSKHIRGTASHREPRLPRWSTPTSRLFRLMGSSMSSTKLRAICTSIGRSAFRACVRCPMASGIRGDGDPLDICVLTERPAAHGDFLARALPIGGLRMIDGNEVDDKIIAVLESDVAYGDLRDITEAPPAVIDRLRHYFLSYKQLPNEAPRRVEIAAVYHREDAVEVIRRSIEDYRATYGPPETRIAELRELFVKVLTSPVELKK